MRLNVTWRAGRHLLIVGWMLSLCACSTMRSGPEMTVRPLPPVACQVACQAVPELNDGGLPAFRRWAADLLNLYHDCRRVHAACAAELVP